MDYIWVCTTQTCADAESASAHCGFVRLPRRAGLDAPDVFRATRVRAHRCATSHPSSPQTDAVASTPPVRQLTCTHYYYIFARLDGEHSIGWLSGTHRSESEGDAAVELGVDTVRIPGVCMTRADSTPPARRSQLGEHVALDPPPRVSGLAGRAGALSASIPTCPRVDSPPRGTPPDSRSAFCAHSIPARPGLLHDSCGVTLPDLGSVLRALDPTLRITGVCTTRACADSTPPARRSLLGERVLCTLDRIPPPSARTDSQRSSPTRPVRYMGSQTETTTPPTRSAPQPGAVRICDVSKPPARSRYRDRKCAHLGYHSSRLPLLMRTRAGEIR
ncbi:hypothetical protein DFH08DRAFT_989761 [Mycena albidolilacea]|uniref:Uncharacterized protein n=1 Tax=Mycena albidolilacea TaxID=1033008 RepID=A0AAD7E7W9_9AGAR|nr:hypothetical protein DFH08DRAFT_989761 [Mycena albidolilacea]